MATAFMPWPPQPVHRQTPGCRTWPSAGAGIWRRCRWWICAASPDHEIRLMEKPPANAGTACSTDRALNPLRINGARHTLRTTDRAVFTQEIICSADRSHELLPLIIPGLPAPRRLPWPAAVPAGGRTIETRRPSRVTAARSASSSVSPVHRFGQGDSRNPDRKQGSGIHPSHH